MNPMMHALRNRRMREPEQEQTDPGAEAGAMVDTKGVEKGEPSSEERMKIQEQIALDDEADSLADADAPLEAADTDEIAMGMLDSRFKSSIPSKPRNLHERVQTNMAKDLKAKGKI